MESKTCTSCGETKDVSEYYLNYGKPRSVCKPCQNEAVSEYQKERPFKAHAAVVRSRAKKRGIPCDIDGEYLESIWTGTCPIFHTKLNKPWHSTNADRASKHTCSLDRIIPEKGYVKGNVEWISNIANMIKSTATASDLYRVADHVHRREKEIAQHEAD